MAAYKRSDPKKLLKEQQEIAQSQAELSQPRDNPIVALGKFLGKKIQQNTDRARGFGPPPILNGAKVLNGPRKRRRTDNSA